MDSHASTLKFNLINTKKVQLYVKSVPSLVSAVTNKPIQAVINQMYTNEKYLTVEGRGLAASGSFLQLTSHQVHFVLFCFLFLCFLLFYFFL